MATTASERVGTHAWANAILTLFGLLAAYGSARHVLGAVFARHMAMIDEAPLPQAPGSVSALLVVAFVLVAASIVLNGGLLLRERRSWRMPVAMLTIDLISLGFAVSGAALSLTLL